MNSSSNPSNVTSARPTVVTVLGTSMPWRCAICVRAVSMAAMSSSARSTVPNSFDDHIQIGQQCRIILRIGLSSGETQQTVGKLGGILLGHGEDHVLQHGTGFGVEPASHAQVEQHDLPTAHHDVAGVRVRVEEAFVEYLRGVVCPRVLVPISFRS